MPLCKENGELVYHCDLGFSIEEREADNFAECFLMPADLFRKICEENSREVNGQKVVDVEKVADCFGLEIKYIISRGINLGIFRG